MSNENQGREYLKVVKDVLETTMGLVPTSTNPQDQRVIIWRQNFTLPTKDWMLIILGDTPGVPMAVNVTPLPTNSGLTETQEVLMKKEITIDVFSRNTEAWERKEEVLMAIASTICQQAQDSNGFVIYPNPAPFVDVSEAEGSSNVYRFRTSYMAHVRYSKTVPITYYDNFKDVAVKSN